MSKIQLKQKFDAAVSALRAHADRLDAKEARGDRLSNADRGELQTHMEAVKAAKHELDNFTESADAADIAATLEAAKSFMAGLGGEATDFTPYAPGLKYVNLSAKGKLPSPAFGEPALKAVTPGFSFGVAVNTQPVAKGRPATSLLDLIPARALGAGVRTFSFMRQTTRTNNAAPVAAGALKPTSVYGLESVEDSLKVIAHLSEPMNQYDLEDNANLARFIEDELRYGLASAVTAQLLTGDGTGENLEGLTVASGTQTQAYVTSPIVTARAALTKLEVVGLTGLAYVLHPSDWADIETATASGSGEFLLQGAGAPIDSIERRLWGVRVVTDVAITAGTGLLIAEDAVELATDGRVKVEWAAAADDFTKNLVRARCEGRFEVALGRPLGVVELDLTAA